MSEEPLPEAVRIVAQELDQQRGWRDAWTFLRAHTADIDVIVKTLLTSEAVEFERSEPNPGNGMRDEEATL